MTNVPTDQCKADRGEIYKQLRDKASCTGTKWFLRIMLVVILAVAGGVGLISRGQGANAGDIKVNASELESQKEQAAIGQAHRATARKEDLASDKAFHQAVMDRFDKADEKQDTMREEFLIHKHNGSPTP